MRVGGERVPALLSSWRLTGRMLLLPLDHALPFQQVIKTLDIEHFFAGRRVNRILRARLGLVLAHEVVDVLLPQENITTERINFA